MLANKELDDYGYSTQELEYYDLYHELLDEDLLYWIDLVTSAMGPGYLRVTWDEYIY